MEKLANDPDLAQPKGCNCTFLAVCLGEWKSTENADIANCPSCNIEFTKITQIFKETNEVAHETVCPPAPVARSAEVTGSVVPETVRSALDANKNVDVRPTSLADAMQQKLDIVKSKWIKPGDEYEDDTFMPLDVTRHKFWKNIMDQIVRLPDEEWRPRIRVDFIGESGVDTGGPSREFFSLLYSNALVSGILDGNPPYVTFRHNQTAMSRGIPKYFGKLTAISLLNGSTGPNYFSPSVANYIFGLDPVSDPEELIMELPDTLKELKSKLDKVRLCENLQGLSDAVLDLPERFDFGFNKANVTMDDKVALIYSAVKHNLISSCLEEILSFQDGLKVYGVLDLLMTYPDEALKLFVDQQLTVKDMQNMFVAKFSPPESTRRQKEDEIYFFWLQMLREVNRKRLTKKYDAIEENFEVVEKESTISLGDVLQFITGSRNKPLSGFQANILFDHNVDSSGQRRMKANTCAPDLSIPVNIRYTESCDKFINNFADDIFDSPGFGQV